MGPVVTDQERQRVEDDLRGVLAGDVHISPVFRQMYASDASIYEIEPLAIVRPRSTEDVAATVRYAAENGLSVHARGAGSGLAGGCLGSGIVIDFSTYLRRVREIDAGRVRVQPGLVLSQLNEQLGHFDRHLGPDPPGRDVRTLGSILATDAKGSHWMRFGSIRSSVESLRVVLADGTVAELSRRVSITKPGRQLRRIVEPLTVLLDEKADVIGAGQPQSLVNGSGYHLIDVRQPGALDLAGLLVGSEGTLGIITEATLKTQPLAHHTGVLLFFFDRLEKAARAALELRSQPVSACDLMDRRLLSLARESDVRYDVVLPKAAEAMLLVECEAADQNQLGRELTKLQQLICRRRKLAFHAKTGIDRADKELFWRLVRHVIPSLYRLTGSQRAVPFIEDVAVPPEALPEFIVSAQNVLKQHQITASFFAHAGHGQVMLRPFMDLGCEDDVARLHGLAADIYSEVDRLNGTIAAQGGNGLSRSWFARKYAGELYPVLREVKHIFDPASTLNPGQIADNNLHLPTQQIRRVPTVNTTVNNSVSTNVSAAGAANDASGAGAPAANGQPIELLLNWQDQEVAQVVRSCNGCGDCRTQASATRMCPIFRFAPAEEASPRAKANLMRGLLTGQLAPTEIVGDEMKGIADLCVHCYQCREECPAGVDIPKLMIEAKAQYVASNGLKFGDWLLTRLDLVTAWASNFRTLSNYMISSRRCRWLIEKTIGIARSRKLPLIAPRSFMQIAARQRLTRPTRSSGRKIVYFVDLYANRFDVQLAKAVVAVFQHNGISVYVPPKQRPSGMALVSLGAVQAAKRIAKRNVTVLSEAIRQGYQVVTSEPSATLCLKREYPNLVDDAAARLVSENTVDACDYLWKLHQQGQLELDLKPLPATVGYHQPCHVRAMGTGSPGQDLLTLIPGLTVRHLEKGCSGMAGTFGLKRKNFRNSLRAGWPLVTAMREKSLPAGTTECSACKIQMEQGTTKPTIHPLKLMALAYGLMPEIADLLKATSEELVVT